MTVISTADLGFFLFVFFALTAPFLHMRIEKHAQRDLDYMQTPHYSSNLHVSKRNVIFDMYVFYWSAGNAQI